VTLHIEKLSEGAYLATSDDLHGLVVQGRTIKETVDIAHDVAQKLIGLQRATAAGRLPVRRLRRRSTIR